MRIRVSFKKKPRVAKQKHGRHGRHDMGTHHPRPRPHIRRGSRHARA
jgi:hypothetical protein